MHRPRLAAALLPLLIGLSTTAAAAAVFVTPEVDAPCAADPLRRQPSALADLDGDGAPERVSVVRDGDALVVRLHRVPGLAEEGRWTLPGDYAEVATTRCRDALRGDLWVHAGRALDPKGERWSFTLRHLAGGQLVEVAHGHTQAVLHVDVDSDGCPDPMVADPDGTGRVLLAGTWRPLPKGLHPASLRGLPVGASEMGPADLHADGDGTLLGLFADGVRLLGTGDLREERAWPGRARAWLALWGGRPVVVTRGGPPDEALGVWALDDGRDLLGGVHLPAMDLLPEIDPTGDGRALAFDGPDGTHVLEVGPPVRDRALPYTLVGPAHDDAPRLGPVRIDADEQPDALGLRVTEHGHPMIAFGGRGHYDLVVLSGPQRTPRTIRAADVAGALSVSAWLVDLERDGRSEIIVSETGSYSSCDMKSSGSTSTLLLLDGEGRVLWQDAPRTSSAGDLRTRWADAEARPVDLFGDGRLALRIRAGGRERWVFPEDAPRPATMPVCLE